jgi:hypothetical protein
MSGELYGIVMKRIIVILLLFVIFAGCIGGSQSLTDTETSTSQTGSTMTSVTSSDTTSQPMSSPSTTSIPQTTTSRVATTPVPNIGPCINGDYPTGTSAKEITESFDGEWIFVSKSNLTKTDYQPESAVSAWVMEVRPPDSQPSSNRSQALYVAQYPSHEVAMKNYRDQDTTPVGVKDTIPVAVDGSYMIFRVTITMDGELMHPDINNKKLYKSFECISDNDIIEPN